jgi:hypothetical protein
VLAVIAPLAFAAASLGATFPNGITIANGSVTSLTPTELTVQPGGGNPTTCTRPSSSPIVAGFKVGELVSIDCQDGVLQVITPSRLLHPGLDLTLIPGIPESHTRVTAMPVPGPLPTQLQCATAWNTTAPVAAQQALGADAAVTAHVTISSVSAPLPGTQLAFKQTAHGLVAVSPVVTGPVCGIWFALPGPRHTHVDGVWKDGTVPEWSGFTQPGFEYINGASFPVSANGTLSNAD